MTEIPNTAGKDAADTTRGLWLALILIAVIFAATALRYRPPAPKAENASTSDFSSARALAALRDVLGDQTPHPVGSAANMRVRDRIIAQLRALGYEPEIQRGFSCDEWADCGAVENIVTRLPGSEPSPAVALSAHYDSVPAGPGASDDGAGVASLLEIARALRVKPVPRHSIILLVTDGEEVGLFGARVFIDGHPWAKDVRADVNLEARGTAGPSFLFETGSANNWAMRLYDGRVSTPITNSIYYTAYKLLPNDTDFTVFKTRDWHGYNFAFTGDVQHYHTPLDDLAHVSPASLQHHGDNALNTLLALANADDLPANHPPAPGAEAASGSESVYLDAFAAGLLRWPVVMALPAAAASMLLFVIAIAVLLRRRHTSMRAIGWALPGVLLPLLLAAGASFGLLALLRVFGALPSSDARYQWLAEPHALEVANATIAVIAVVLSSIVVARRAGFWGTWIVVGLLINAAGLASAALLPGLSFALLLPSLAMLVCALPALFSTRDTAAPRAFATVLPLAIAVSSLLPTVWFLYSTLGLGLLPAVALLGVWLLLLLMPLLAGAQARARRACLGLAGLVLIAAFVMASTRPIYTPDSPQRLNFEYALDADSGHGQWIARPDSGQLPASVVAAVPFTLRATVPPLPWGAKMQWSADGPKQELSAPEFTVLSSEPQQGGMRYHAHLASTRGASLASVCFAPESGITRVTMSSYALPEPEDKVRAVIAARRNGWRCFADHTLTGAGVDLQFDLATAQPVDLIVSDRSAGLPPEGDALLKSRPANTTRSQEGDTTRVVRRIKLQAAGS